MDQLDLFTLYDVTNAEEIYNDIKSKLSKYGIEEHMKKVEQFSIIWQIEEHLRKHDNYENYLKEMNGLIKQHLKEVKDFEKLFSIKENAYFDRQDGYIHLHCYNGKHWSFFKLMHFGEVNENLFRKDL